MEKVIQNGFTRSVSAIASIDSDKVLVGAMSGIINLWQYSKPGRLSCIQNNLCTDSSLYAQSNSLHSRNRRIRDAKKIEFIVPLSEGKYVTVNKEAEIRLWETGSNIYKMQFERGAIERGIDSVVVLPNNLLVMSGVCKYHCNVWECFDVWDINTSKCIFKDMSCCHKPEGLSLSTTANGCLVTCIYWSGSAGGIIRIWKVNHLECTVKTLCDIGRVYSMAVLHTGEIVTSSHDIDFYKISDDKGIYKFKTFSNGNIIDKMYPVAGYKVLYIDRSNSQSGSVTMKLLNIISQTVTVLGHNEMLLTLAIPPSLQGIYLSARMHDSIPFENHCRSSKQLSKSHIVLEQQDVIIELGKNKIVLHEFSEDTFRFPKNLAEIRKCARILSQACRTETSYFANLPMEISLKIAVMTSDNMNEYEKQISVSIAENYFCTPSFR